MNEYNTLYVVTLVYSSNTANEVFEIRYIAWYMEGMEGYLGMMCRDEMIYRGDVSTMWVEVLEYKDIETEV